MSSAFAILPQTQPAPKPQASPAEQEFVSELGKVAASWPDAWKSQHEVRTRSAQGDLAYARIYEKQAAYNRGVDGGYSQRIAEGAAANGSRTLNEAVYYFAAQLRHLNQLAAKAFPDQPQAVSEFEVHARQERLTASASMNPKTLGRLVASLNQTFQAESRNLIQSASPDRLQAQLDDVKSPNGTRARLGAILESASKAIAASVPTAAISRI